MQFPAITIKDIIAITVIFLLAVLKYMGHDGQLDQVASLGLGYYFGHRKSGVDKGV